MTQIVLHPRIVARFGPYGGARVNLVPPWMWWETRLALIGGNEMVIRCEPAPENISDYFVTFGPDRDRVVITDPPAMFLIHLTEIGDVYSAGDCVPRSMLMASSLTARVVWWCQPGQFWQPVPHVTTCRPGEYVQDSHTVGRRGGRDYERERRERDWNDAYYEPRPDLDWPCNVMTVDGQLMAAPTLPLSWDRCRQCQRYLPETRTEVRNWGGDLIAVLRNGGGLCDECRQMQQRAGSAWTLDGITSLRGAFMTPNELREREGLPPIPGAEGFAPGGYIQPDGGLELPYRQPPSAPRYGPSIKPEQDVVDEIDRLVNEQILAGPRDDYNVNRYPKCQRCGHDWHGIVCEQCVCLGELEDPI